LAIELATLPKMPAGDLHRAVMWEAKERLATDLSSYSVRHLVIGETTSDGQTQYEIMIVATQREGVVSRWRTFTNQGFRVLAMEPGILASLAACETAGIWRRDEFVGVLEMGRRYSTLAFLINGLVRFVRSFPIAGDSITQSIIDYCQLEYEAAEQQKREIGLSQMALEEDRRVTGLEVEPRVRVSHALGLYLERLAAELDHSLRYLTFELGHAKGRKLDALYLTGGGALLKNLSAFLANRLTTRVEASDPLRSCAMTPEAKDRLQAPLQGAQLTCALGLALHPITR
jgi:type IV pilus assembly protein PilM